MIMDYFTLFGVAFISATIFPMGSEALFAYDLAQNYDAILLIGAATFGNSLGSVVNYYLAIQGESFLEEKKIIKKAQLEKAQKYFTKFGGFALLFAWVPIIGDPITFIAGILRYDIKKFIILVTISKFSRYFFIYLVLDS